MTGVFAILGIAYIQSKASISANPSYLYSGKKIGSSFTTASTTVYISGGIGPFTQLWTFIFEDGSHSFSINSPTSLTTTFDIGGIGPEELCNATARCTITDIGSSGATSFVDVDIQHFRSLGIGVP